MVKMKALLPTALIFGGAYILPPTAFAQTPQDDVIVMPLKVRAVPNTATFDSLLAVPKLIISEDDANSALKDMGLDRKGAGAFTWEQRTGDRGNYVFENVRAKDNSGTLGIDKMTFSGLRMDGRDTTFDRLDLYGVRNDAKKKGVLTFDRISMSRPSPEVVEWVVNFFDNPSSLSLDSEDYEPELDAFGAFYLSNFKIDSEEEEMTGHIAEMGWGTSDDQKGTILIHNASLSGVAEDNQVPVDIRIGHLAATGLNMDNFQKGMEAIDFSDLTGTIRKRDQLSTQENPFSQKYDLIQIADFSVKADSARLHLEDLTASQQKIGSKLSTQLTLRPFSFSFSEVPTGPELLEAYESLAKIGFDNISLLGNSQSMVDEATDSFTGNSHFDLVDLMSIGTSYAGNGFGGFISAMREVENTDDMTDEEAMTVFSELSFNSLNLSFRDVSIIDKILSIAAEETDETPDMLKTKAKSLLMMGAFMAQNPSQMALASEASSALSTLIDEGGEVTIKIQPDTPLTIGKFLEMDLDKPKNIDISELGISIEHKK